MYKNKSDKFQVWTPQDEAKFEEVDSAEPIQPERWEYTRDFHIADVAVNKYTGYFSLVTYKTTNEDCYFIKFSYSIPNSSINRLLGYSAVGVSVLEPSPSATIIQKNIISKYVNSIIG